MASFLARRKNFLLGTISERRRKARREWRKTPQGRVSRRSAKRKAECMKSQRRRYAVWVWMVTHQSEIDAHTAEMARRKADRVRRKKQNYRGRLAGAVGRLSVGIRQRLFEAQEARCAACQVKWPLRGFYGLHLDHIQPLSRGGSNHDDNIQLLCQPCNTAKSDRTMEEFQAPRI